VTPARPSTPNPEGSSPTWVSPHSVQVLTAPVHAGGAVAVTLLKVPRVHPVEQLVQAVAPAAEYGVASGHVLHTVAPLALRKPAGQWPLQEAVVSP
jgi:hypothetical protein